MENFGPYKNGEKDEIICTLHGDSVHPIAFILLFKFDGYIVRWWKGAVVMLYFFSFLEEADVAEA